MSQENVEVARGVFDAWKAGDMEAVRDLYDPNVIVRPMSDWPEPGPWLGREAVMRQWEQMRDAWSADAVEPISDFIDAADRVVVRQLWRGAGRGPDLNMEMTNVFMVRGGRIVYQEFFWDHAEALETLGLSEQAMSQENVELVYRLNDAFKRRDLDAYLALCDPDVEYYSRFGNVEGGGPYRGHEGVRSWWGKLLAFSPDFRTEIEAVQALGNVTVARVRQRAQGAESDAPVEQTQWIVTRWRNGKAVWGHIFLSEAEELETAGLSE